MTRFRQISFAAVCFSALSVGASTIASAQATSFIIQKGKAGVVSTGMSVDSLYRVVGRDHTKLVDRFNEGMFDPVLEITLPGATKSPSLVASVREVPCAGYLVQSIEVRDSRFRTADSLGIGSTLGEIRKAHPTVKTNGADGFHASWGTSRVAFDLDNATNGEKAHVTSVMVVGDVSTANRSRCGGK